MDWASVGEVVKVLAPVATAGAAWFAAIIAYRGLNKWRAETIGKRKAELAEQALVAFYVARSAGLVGRSCHVLRRRLHHHCPAGRVGR